MLSFFPRDVLDEILNLIESVSEGFPSYAFNSRSRLTLFRLSDNPKTRKLLCSRGQTCPPFTRKFESAGVSGGIGRDRKVLVELGLLAGLWLLGINPHKTINKSI